MTHSESKNSKERTAVDEGSCSPFTRARQECEALDHGHRDDEEVFTCLLRQVAALRIGRSKATQPGDSS